MKLSHGVINRHGMETCRALELQAPSLSSMCSDYLAAIAFGEKLSAQGLRRPTRPQVRLANSCKFIAPRWTRLSLNRFISRRLLLVGLQEGL